MTEKKVSLSKKDRLSVMLRSQFLQGSWNYERMQNGGWAFSLIPALKKLYPNPEDSKAALKRHLEFFNTHPYIASPILGVTLALEEDRANGAQIDDATIQGVKVGMMGPLAGIGDPVFWFTIRPILGAIAKPMKKNGHVSFEAIKLITIANPTATTMLPPIVIPFENHSGINFK